MAVRNGHTRLASLLLQRGSEWNHKDSSDNTPLHYAAASGFIECIDLLIKHGADVNAFNSWKITPITIAMLNNHNGTVKRLLQEPGIDVNGKDDKGRTLLSMTMMDISDSSCIEFTKFLLEKGADVNMTDVEGNCPLVLLAPKLRSHWGNHYHYVVEGRLKVLVLVDLLIAHGANINA
jgi:ankyrin repeat protein